MSESLHIAFLCPRYLWAGGGSIIYTRHLAAEMEKLGYQVTIVGDAVEGEDHPEIHLVERDVSIEVRAQKKLDLEQRRGGYRLAKWLFRDGKQQLIAAGPVCPELYDPAFYSDFDVVALMNSGSTAWTLAVNDALRQNRGKDKIAYAFPFFHPHEGVSAYSVLAKLHQVYEAVCTLTDYEKHFMADRGWNENIVTMGAGSYGYSAAVDPNAFRDQHDIPTDAPLVLFMGRKIFNKGITHVVEAMDAVWDKYPEAYLALLGFSHNPDAWLEGYLNASRHHKRQQVVSLSDVDDQTHEEAMAASTLVVAPSISDSFGMVFLDAWRYRKPVIACKDTCCETYIEHERDGLLVEFGNVLEIGEAMIALIGSEDDARSYGQSGYVKWQTQFQWPHVAERFSSLIQIDHVG